MNIIALCSPAMGSGKSVVAQHLVDKHGFALVKFAGPLKGMIATLLREAGFAETLIPRYVDGDLKEAVLGDMGPFLPRYAKAMLESLGTLPEIIRLQPWELEESLLGWGMEYFVAGTTSRKLQQQLGTEWGRDTVHPNIWVAAACLRVTQHDDVVIDDMRFPNEYDAVLKMGGLPVRIFRPGIKVTVSHASEGHLDNVTMTTIMNDSTIPNLLIDADRLVREVRPSSLNQ